MTNRAQVSGVNHQWARNSKSNIYPDRVKASKFVICHLSFVIGYWLLVIGYWLLVIYGRLTPRMVPST